ncbi:hypothetical protein Y032_0147g2610 [Ancylostoma ceylanicum]|uniref:Uncharacterized protein n=1 Tax=Ancylostoma ceylanicum TaxID=53326 RepID=A0A016T2E5_9BILA|nr:hypothetical protein Y032_0147g2610 [Ancylostoma ceylanicum]
MNFCLRCSTGAEPGQEQNLLSASPILSHDSVEDVLVLVSRRSALPLAEWANPNSDTENGQRSTTSTNYNSISTVKSVSCFIVIF